MRLYAYTSYRRDARQVGPHGGYKVRKIQGPSGPVTAGRCKRFNDAAHAYARAHNAVVVNALRWRDETECPLTTQSRRSPCGS